MSPLHFLRFRDILIVFRYYYYYYDIPVIELLLLIKRSFTHEKLTQSRPSTVGDCVTWNLPYLKMMYSSFSISSFVPYLISSENSGTPYYRCGVYLSF